MARLSLLIDVTKCSGCYNCFLACRDEYFDNDYASYSAPQPLEGQFWMQLVEVERGTYPKPRLDYIPLPCLHCESAPCIDAAADNAVYRRPDGIVIIDPQKAKGQKSIVNSCPYRVVFWNAELDLPQKCTLCAHRLDEGEKQPRCVEACPTGALVFGDLDDPNSEIAKLAKTANVEVYHPEYNAAPTVKYIGVPKRFIVGEVVRRDVPGECAEGVKVTLLEGDKVALETATDSYGDFEFDGLDKDKAYDVRVDLPGYASMIIEVGKKRDIDLGPITLEPFN
jgi:Fe-S-cluster-containing dehydrogenase component